jgi:lipopolysaccharide transport system ATP-binding protein
MKSLRRGVLRCEARGLPITAGQYLLSAWLGDWQEDHDSKLDILSIFIGDDRIDPLRPAPSVLGHLDWPAVWRTRLGEAAVTVQAEKQ